MSWGRPAATSAGSESSGTVSTAAIPSAFTFLSYRRRKCFAPPTFRTAKIICAQPETAGRQHRLMCCVHSGCLTVTLQEGLWRTMRGISGEFGVCCNASACGYVLSTAINAVCQCCCQYKAGLLAGHPSTGNQKQYGESQTALATRLQSPEEVTGC